MPVGRRVACSLRVAESSIADLLRGRARTRVGKVAFAFHPLAFYQSHTGGLIQTVDDEQVSGFLTPFVVIVPKTQGLYRWSLGGVNFERTDNPDGSYRILGRSDQPATRFAATLSFATGRSSRSSSAAE